jgi:hypothetical protein
VLQSLWIGQQPLRDIFPCSAMQSRVAIICVLLAISSCSIGQAGGGEHRDFDCSGFAAVFGCPGLTKVEPIQGLLSEHWAGKSRDDMQVCLNEIILRRGSMAAVKNGRQSLLSLSSTEALFVVHVVYDRTGRVTRAECRLREKNRPAELVTGADAEQRSPSSGGQASGAAHR